MAISVNDAHPRLHSCSPNKFDEDELKKLSDYYSSFCNDKDDSSYASRFRPTHGDFVIGNKDSVSFVKSWLHDWTKKPPADLNANGMLRRKRKVRLDDSDSDFIPESEDDSDDELSNKSKAVLLVGPCGCGKTSLVYTVCQEQGFKVVEINASAVRSGKMLTEQFKAATGLHRVDANCLLKESTFKSVSSTNDSVPRSNAENKGTVNMKKPDMKSAFNKLFGGFAKSSKGNRHSKEPSTDSTESVAKSATSGPLDAFFGGSSLKNRKDSKQSCSQASVNESKKTNHTSFNIAGGKKRKNTSIVVVDSDDDKSAIDPITIEESDSEEEFQVKRRRKKLPRKPAKFDDMEDSDIEIPAIQRYANGLALESKTLYLIDEVDVAFSERDVGFAPALCRLIASGEKPFILTSSSLSGVDRTLLSLCLIVEMSRPSRAELSKHLFAIANCLGKSNISECSVRKIAKLSQCDVRSALNNLHFLDNQSKCSNIEPSEAIPNHLPDTLITKNLEMRSELETLFSQVEMNWNTLGVPMKDTLLETQNVAYKNMIDLRDDLRQSVGQTLCHLTAEFTSLYGTRRKESNMSSSVHLCSCLDQLILIGREGFAEHLLCGADYPTRYFHDRTRMQRFAESASAIRCICRSEIERKLMCSDRQKRRFFHYLNDFGCIDKPEAGVKCLAISKL